MILAGAVILPGLVGCLPAEFTVQGDVFDMAGECWDTNVTVTLSTKYWREQYLGTGSGDCDWSEGAVPTADGRCVVMPMPCEDHPPTIDHDPAFSFDHDDIVICTAAYNGEYPWKACPPPALTEWP